MQQLQLVQEAAELRSGLATSSRNLMTGIDGNVNLRFRREDRVRPLEGKEDENPGGQVWGGVPRRMKQVKGALGKLDSLWNERVYLGIKGKTGEIITGDEEGVRKTRTIRRKQEAERGRAAHAAIQKAGVSEVAVPLMNEPLGCQQLNFILIPAEHNDPPLLGLDFHRKMDGGVFIDYRNSMVIFHDDPQRACKLPRGPRRLQRIPLLEQPLEEVTSNACLRKFVKDEVQTVTNVGDVTMCFPTGQCK